MTRPIRTIDLKYASKIFKSSTFTTPVFENISYTFHKGQTYAIIGSSGSGKSTLLHCIAGLEPLTAGTVLFNNETLSDNNISTQSFLHKNVGLMFQNPYLIQEFTVIENVMIKGMIEGAMTSIVIEDARELLKTMGLLEKQNDPVWTLSGGQQQRVALARALLNKPDFVIADEPTGNLDPETGKTIIDLLKSYQQDHNIGIIIATHDAQVIAMMDIHLLVKNNQLYEI